MPENTDVTANSTATVPTEATTETTVAVSVAPATAPQPVAAPIPAIQTSQAAESAPFQNAPVAATTAFNPMSETLANIIETSDASETDTKKPAVIPTKELSLPTRLPEVSGPAATVNPVATPTPQTAPLNSTTQTPQTPPANTKK